MKTIALIAFICFTNLHISAQDNNIIWNESRVLNWADFAGEVKEASQYDAESFAEVKFRYTFNSPNDFYFEVFANFNKTTSWCRKEHQCEALLKHEQVHFDIAGLYAQKLKQAFESYQYTKNFRNEIAEIFNQKKLEYHLMQHKYDEETNHSLDKQKQKEWEKFVQTELTGIKVKYDYAKK